MYRGTKTNQQLLEEMFTIFIRIQVISKEITDMMQLMVNMNNNLSLSILPKAGRTPKEGRTVLVADADPVVDTDAKTFVCDCGYISKTVKGLAIHRGIMKKNSNNCAEQV